MLIAKPMFASAGGLWILTAGFTGGCGVVCNAEGLAETKKLEVDIVANIARIKLLGFILRTRKTAFYIACKGTA